MTGKPVADTSSAASAAKMDNGEPSPAEDTEPHAPADHIPELAARTMAGLEVEINHVCGLDLPILRRKADFFAACAGDLPIRSTGLVLWECATLLADYLCYARWLNSSPSSAQWWQTHLPAAVVPARFWQGKRVLELGGGCGMVASALACLGAEVLCTDGDVSALATARRNAEEARRKYPKEWGSATFLSLSFGDAQRARQLVKERGPFDFIVGSDLLYGDKAPAQPLVDTLAALTSEPGCANAQVIIAVKNRCADEIQGFMRIAKARGMWNISTADPDDLLEGFDGCSEFYGSEGPTYAVFRLASALAALDAHETGSKRPAAEVASTDDAAKRTRVSEVVDVACSARSGRAEAMDTRQIVEAAA